jgi:hypothetical protein
VRACECDRVLEGCVSLSRVIALATRIPICSSTTLLTMLQMTCTLALCTCSCSCNCSTHAHTCTLTHTYTYTHTYTLTQMLKHTHTHAHAANFRAAASFSAGPALLTARPCWTGQSWPSALQTICRQVPNGTQGSYPAPLLDQIKHPSKQGNPLTLRNSGQLTSTS